jgi:hypothetical protein
VLEVVAWRPAAREAVVLSGVGQRSQWYRNVLAGQAVEVRVARLRFAPDVRPLGSEEAVGVLADYERRNRLAAPLVRAVLSKLAGFRYDGSEPARRRLVHTLPLVAFARAPNGCPPARHVLVVPLRGMHRAATPNRPPGPGSRPLSTSSCWRSAATPTRAGQPSPTSPGTCFCATTARWS